MDTSYPTSDNEAERLAALHRYRVLDTPTEEAFDTIVKLASEICEAPIALISLVDEHRQWFKSKLGLDVTETPREISFCTHTILSNEPMVIPDATLDPRFAQNPLVTESPNIRLYAGVPLVTSNDSRVGTLCVIDSKQRNLTESQIRQLGHLARQVVQLLEYRLHSLELDSVNRAVAEKSNLLDMTLRCANLGFWDWNAVTNETQFNDVWYTMLGYSPGELPMHLDTWKALCHPDDLEKAMSAISAYFRGETPMYRCVQRLRKKNGEWLWIEDVGQVTQYDLNGNPLRLLGFHIDIDQLKQHEAALEANAHAMEEFLANMSHEIRTPMNGLIGMTDLLLESPLSSEQREWAATVRHAGESLLQIVNEILDISKLRAGKVHLAPSFCDIHGFGSHIEKLHHSVAEKKGIRFSFTIDPAVPRYLFVDATRLEQICMNLIGNAFKFTPSNGTVRGEICLVEKGDSTAVIRISISDTGIGIPKEKQKRIFEAFEQADSSTFRAYGGTGLGLSISSRLTQLMKSELKLVSEPGRGTTFSFQLTLPFQERLDTSDTTTVFSAADPKQSQPLSILVAEDNLVNQKLVSTLLERAGHLVTIAQNGQEAITACEAKNFDLILMDINMPGMTGLEASAAIRKNERTQKIPIIALTANAFESDRQRCLESGLNGFIAKPLRKDDLFREIERVQTKATEESC